MKALTLAFGPFKSQKALRSLPGAFWLLEGPKAEFQSSHEGRNKQGLIVKGDQACAITTQF